MTARRTGLSFLSGAILLPAVLLSACQDSTDETSGFTTEIDPVSLGQRIISADDFIARVDAKDRPGPMSAADQKDIITFLQETYAYEDILPPDVVFKDGYVIIENLDTGYEKSKEERYSGPKIITTQRIGADIWVFDTIAFKDVRRNDDMLRIDDAKWARPQTEAFEEALAAASEFDNLYDILTPEYFEPIFLGSSGYARGVNIELGRSNGVIDFIAWDSDADSKTLSFRADGISYDGGEFEGVIEIEHISATDLHYPALMSAFEVLTQGGLGYIFPDKLFKNIDPFSSPYRSISLRGLSQKSPFTTTNLKSLNLWVTEEKNGKFENFAQVQNFSAASEHVDESDLFHILPVKGFGYDNFSLNYRAHARLDKVSDRWTETIELDSPELSHVKIDLDIDGYYGVRQTFKSLFERGYRSDKDEPQGFEKTAEAALENWRINNIDIYWDDRGAIRHSLNFMESQYQYGDPKTEDEILEEFDRDLGRYWFSDYSAPALLSLKEDYISAMKSLAREDGYFAITTNPPARGTPMSGAMTLKGGADEATLVSFLKELNLEIRHLPKLP